MKHWCIIKMSARNILFVIYSVRVFTDVIASVVRRIHASAFVRRASRVPALCYHLRGDPSRPDVEPQRPRHRHPTWLGPDPTRRYPHTHPHSKRNRVSRRHSVLTHNANFVPQTHNLYGNM